MANPTLVTAPTAEPITIGDAKTQLRVDFSTDDSYIEAQLIPTARKKVEDFLGRRLHLTTYDYYVDEFPSRDFIELPLAPLSSITSLKYTDSDGTETTWDTSNYFAVTSREPGVLKLAYAISWPAVTLKPAEAIVIRYVVGYEGSNTGTGTLASTGTAVTGTTTAFTTELSIGDIIFADGYARRVTAIASDTSLTVDAAWGTNLSGESFTYYEPIPYEYRQAIAKTVDHLYKFRGSETPAPGEERTLSGIPKPAEGLLWPSRIVSA